MRTIKTTTGEPITLDGDLLAIMEALYREVTAKRALERSFEDLGNIRRRYVEGQTQLDFDVRLPL